MDRLENLAIGMRRVVLASFPPRPAFEIVVVVAHDGTWALRDACPHYGVALSDGRLSNGYLECTWHGWQIDIRTGGCLHNPRTQTSTYETEIIDGALYVVVPDPTTHLGHIPQTNHE